MQLHVNVALTHTFSVFRLKSLDLLCMKKLDKKVRASECHKKYNVPGLI